jgi:hypothetical protein
VHLSADLGASADVDLIYLFNNVVLKLEANSITATEAFQTYSELICQLQERKTHTFIPFSAK